MKQYSQRGVTFLELTVSLVIISISVAGVLALMSYSSRQSLGILQRSEFIKVMDKIELDLYQQISNLPAANVPALNQNFNFENFKQSFGQNYARKVCYDIVGQPVDVNSNLCEFQVRFYKIREKDRLYSHASANQFDDAPLVRLVYSVSYKDKVTGDEKTYYFSRVKAMLLKM
jgi:type II secretory pathway pseudopilin PulG